MQHILDNYQYGVIVETPEKLSGKKQFTPEQDIDNKKNSHVRVHVERAIHRVKVFGILKGNLPIRYVHHISKLWKVCCWLTALILPPLVSASRVAGGVKGGVQCSQCSLRPQGLTLYLDKLNAG